MTPQKWGVIFNYIFPKTLLIRLAVKRSQRGLKSRKISAIFFSEKGKKNILIRYAVKRSKGSILYNISK